MGVIYELLKLPDRDRKSFVKGIIHQESIERLKSQETHDRKIQTRK